MSLFPGSRTLILAGLLLLSATAHAQAQPAPTQIVPPEVKQIEQHALIEDFKRGTYGPITAAQLEQVEAGHVIIVLESLFPVTTDHDVKVRIARELVSLHDPSPLPWEFLDAIARPALELDIPQFQVYENAGPFPTPEMYAWFERHNVTDLGQAIAQMAQAVSDYQMMATSGDPRAIPIARKALASPNREVRAAAASSLSMDHDTASIPAIIDLLHHASASEQTSLAQILLTFDDPAATSAARAILPPEPTPLDQMRRGDFSNVAVEQAVTHHQTEVIPLLQTKFAQTSDLLIKDKLASALIRFHDPNPIYWNYLYERARTVIESGAPPPFAADATGKPTGISPEFTAWANAHNIPAAGEDILYTYPAPVVELAATEDPRIIPLLREGLNSNHPMVAATSMQGLEQVQAPGIIDYVLEQCARHPAEAVGIAVGLITFDADPKAEQAAARFLSPEMISELRKERAERHPSAP